jgi:hypothetical protein
MRDDEQVAAATGVQGPSAPAGILGSLPLQASCIAQRKTNGRFICEKIGPVKAATLLGRKDRVTSA